MTEEEFKQLLDLSTRDKQKYLESLIGHLKEGELTTEQYELAYQKLNTAQYHEARLAYQTGESKKLALDPFDMAFRPTENLFPGDDVKKYSLEWWANYFYQECPANEKKKFFKQVYRMFRGREKQVRPELDPSSPTPRLVRLGAISWRA